MSTEAAWDGAAQLWGVSVREYNEDDECERSTHLKDYIRNPKWYEGLHVAKTVPKKEQTSFIAIGSCFHDILLDDTKSWVVWKGGDKRKNAKLWKEFKLASEGCPILTPDEEQDIYRMYDAVHASPLASSLLFCGVSEQAIRWTHDSGIRCKVRLDRLQDNHAIADLKVVDDWSGDYFARSVTNFGYHIQQAYYEQGRNAVFGETQAPFVFVVVCRNPPYFVRVCELPADAVALGHEQVNAALWGLARATDTGNFPDPESELITEVDLPGWFYTQHKVKEERR